MFSSCVCVCAHSVLYLFDRPALDSTRADWGSYKFNWSFKMVSDRPAAPAPSPAATATVPPVVSTAVTRADPTQPAVSNEATMTDYRDQR